MKKIIFSIVLLLGSAAMADHSLQDAMNENANVKKAVNALMAAKGVTCNLTGTLQLASQRNDTDTWRQVALCYKDAKAMATDNATLSKGNEFGGIYGLGASAILDVTYENFSKGRVIDISLK